MEPMTYGEVIADHLAELRRTAAQERAARQLSSGQVSGWRRFSGRVLVRAGEKLQGCVAEPQPRITVSG